MKPAQPVTGRTEDPNPPVDTSKEETQERLSFANDLTPERKEELVRNYAETIRQELDKPRLTINFVVRLVNRQFRQVAALAKQNESATEAIDTLVGKTEQLVKNLVNKLNPEQREALIKQLQDSERVISPSTQQ
jgi:hypothetical protein